MITNFFFPLPLHKHAEPAQRLLGVEQLPSDSEDLAHLLAADPAPEVRAAAAQRCADVTVLSAAWGTEADPAVRVAIAAALASALAVAQDGTHAQAMLDAGNCTDAIRAEVARRARNPARRRAAIAGIRDEAALIGLALGAVHADTRTAAAERVQTPAVLKQLADGARNKDRGVARLARQRIDAINDRLRQQAEANAIILQLEALAVESGPILTALVELDRRWGALDMTGDPDCLARFGAARGTIQARFDRENRAQQARTQFERRLRKWIGTFGPTAPPEPDALAALRADLAELRAEAQQRRDDSALSALDQAHQRIAQWEREREALAVAEALVAEAEQLAEGASVDDAKLLTGWQALDRAIRTQPLTRRFEAALLRIEQRRIDRAKTAKREASARWQGLQGLLDAAEQALVAGQLRAARATVEEIRTLVAGAGEPPKPSAQRLARLLKQLAELERWESFGQRSARLQLCERAEALAAPVKDATRLALEVRTLRGEWKALDQQHAGVPRALWQRFDAACEKAYAPAARHFAELAAHRKEARKRREAFLAAAAAHGPTLLGEPRDWRAIERWLRDTDRVWREGDLGSVEPGQWKNIDAQYKAALAQLRDALSAAREQAKAGRRALIEEAKTLSSRASERETPSQLKAIQARWQEQAKALSLAPRDERALWEQFRTACDAVFNTRHLHRKEEEARKQEICGSLEDLCLQLEQLAHMNDKGATDRDDQALRRLLRERQEQWNARSRGFGPALREIESRFNRAKAAVEAMVSARARSRSAAVWETLAAKERLCDELDALVQSGAGTSEAAARPALALEQWMALPALPLAWEQKMTARRDTALRALSDAAAASDYLSRIEHGAESRAQGLLALELSLGLDSPPELQSQRLALQVKQLKDRFKGARTTGADTVGEQLLVLCGLPGVSGAGDRQRRERIFSSIGKAGK